MIFGESMAGAICGTPASFFAPPSAVDKNGQAQ